MIRTSLFEIITSSARQAFKLQNADGSMPPGHNGPYNDLETPVRNTGHWLMIFKKAYEISGEQTFKEGAYRCLQYLMGKESRPQKATFWHRKNPQKDSTNGLVGQAWTIEALIDGYQLFEDEKALLLAEEVFNLHPYIKSVQGWKIVNVDGTAGKFDYTFNHQLWFAAIGSVLMKILEKENLNGVRHFTSAIPKNIQIYSNGVIKHIPTFYLKKSAYQKIRAMGSYFKRELNGSSYIYSKSVGYHGFNLYALALLDKTLSEYGLFKMNKLAKALNVIERDTFRKDLNTSKYGYPYNPAGIELAFTYDVLGNTTQRDYWISQQISRTFDFSTNLMQLGGTFDKETAAARLYEAVRIRDCEVQID
ncbi:hypothetical protein JHJ32_00040 [Parapedobacter sp. ISTM3]|uniref:hypothetical protein n=1 Tax=Parapedobacter sp. ISTM3 TaxID=2800130 RepID=UPI00190861C6|nr:hypothetical protein [Parapedobacter sp. ISTM3]MBK1438360.1 hypothetical protein [Parapedobacter sp. ISTM3]